MKRKKQALRQSDKCSGQAKEIKHPGNRSPWRGKPNGGKRTNTKNISENFFKSLKLHSESILCT